jgi:hypothetical protein
MKQLLTCLVYVYALVLVPNSVAAQTIWDYYYFGEANNWTASAAEDAKYHFGQTSSPTDEIIWTLTLSGSQLDFDKDGNAYFAVHVKTDATGDGNRFRMGPANNNDGITPGSGSVAISNNSNSFLLGGVDQNALYKLTFVSNAGRESGTLSVEKKTITIRGALKDSWNTAIPYSSMSDSGIYLWNFTREQIKGEISNISNGYHVEFKLFLDDGTENGKWFGNGTEVTDSWVTLSGGGAGNCYIEYDEDITSYTIQAKYENGVWKVRVVENVDNHDYYWVSPQVTDNQMLSAFKLIASRNRNRDGEGKVGDGQISNRYYTFTIKDDDLKYYNGGAAISASTQVDWKIVRDDGQVWYCQTTANNVGENNNSGDHDAYISYMNFNKRKVTDSNAEGQGLFYFEKGFAKSYTFVLNSIKGNISFNYANNGIYDTDSGTSRAESYKLIGNFTSAKGNVDIDFDSGPVMTKLWYKGGVEYTEAQESPDSIVFTASVQKPAEGWGELYLLVNPVGNKDYSAEGVAGAILRPIVSIGNNLDGRALYGGLMSVNYSQSINPEPKDSYSGYTFRFNATTMTYMLQFHTSISIVGPAASGTENSLGSWDLSNISAVDPRIGLSLAAPNDANHYRARVYMTQGKKFRFLKCEDENTDPTYENSWKENDYAPKWVGASEDDDYYPYNETQSQYETQYKNYLSTASTAPSDNDNDNNILFDLPTGWYYVNFYDEASPYYTIEREVDLRDFNEVYYRSASGTAEQRNVKGRNDYNFLRVWSDHIAWNKPDNIDVFVVSAFDRNTETHTTTATLTKLNIDYIPAKTGVILGCKLSKDNLTSGLVYDNAATLAWDNGEYVNYYNTLTAELTPYSAPSTSNSGESKLIPLYEETSLQRFSDETGIGTGEDYANYLFGFYRCKKYQKNYIGNDNDFDMGFWLTTGIGKTYANSAFLHLTKAQAEDLGVGTAYDTSASAPAFYLMFEDASASEYTTGIRNDRVQNVSSDEWFTLEGRRVASPTGKGLYIHNGKKVVIR